MNRVIVALAVWLVLTVLLEAVRVPHDHPVLPWHDVPGVAAVIGLFGSIIVVLLTRWLGRTFLQRPEPPEPPEIAKTDG